MARDTLIVISTFNEQENVVEWQCIRREVPIIFTDRKFGQSKITRREVRAASGPCGRCGFGSDGRPAAG